VQPRILKAPLPVFCWLNWHRSIAIEDFFKEYSNLIEESWQNYPKYFTILLSKINAALVSIRGFFAKTFKNLTNPKHLGWMSFCKSLKTSQLQNLFVISNPPEKQTQVLSIILHLAMSRGGKICHDTRGARHSADCHSRCLADVHSIHNTGSKILWGFKCMFL